jgi:hypothetical protein
MTKNQKNAPKPSIRIVASSARRPPLHADFRGAQHVQDRGKQQRIEADEEYVAERRERIDAEQPVRRVLQVTERIDDDRRRQVPPRPPDGQRRGATRGHASEHRRSDARGCIAEQVEDLRDRPT